MRNLARCFGGLALALATQACVVRETTPVNAGYGYGYGYDNRYGGGYMGARVTSVTQVQRRSNGGLKVYGYATTGGGGYGGYNGYGGGPGYGYGAPAYGGPGYNGYGYGAMQGDAQFDCTIDRYGRITDIDAKRNRNRNYGYRGY